MTSDLHYRRPGRMTRAFNSAVALLTRRGISVWGSRVLEVPGRRSGLPRTTPVNVLTLGGQQYLVSARGETEWVRNLRGNGGELTLVLGLGREVRGSEEVPDADKAPVLRAYLARWALEVGMFFDGVGAGSSDAELVAAGSLHPVFRLLPVETNP